VAQQGTTLFTNTNLTPYTATAAVLFWTQPRIADQLNVIVCVPKALGCKG